MRALAVHRRLRGLRGLAVGVVLVAASLVLGACAPQLGGANGAADGSLHGDGEVTTVAARPPATEAAAERVGAGAGSPGAETAPLSRFGLLTPLFPGLSSGAAAPCEPDDFYGGCL